MQRSLRSLLSVDAADFTGLMSGKVKYYVEKAFSNADSSIHEAFRKLGDGPLEDGTKNALEQYTGWVVTCFLLGYTVRMFEYTVRTF